MEVEKKKKKRHLSGEIQCALMSGPSRLPRSAGKGGRVTGGPRRAEPPTAGWVAGGRGREPGTRQVAGRPSRAEAGLKEKWNCDKKEL